MKALGNLIKRKAFTWTNSIYCTLNKSQKLYFISISCLLFQLIFRYLPSPIDNLFLTISIVFISWAVIFDTLQIYKALWETIIGKGILLLSYTLIVNISLSIGAQYVNEVVGIEPYLYKHTIIFSAILSTPLLSALILGILSFFIITLGMFYLFFKINIQKANENGFLDDILPVKKERYFILTTIIRIISIASISYACFSFFSGYNDKYNEFILKQTKLFLYNFESFDKSRCSLKKGVRYLPVSDKEIVTIVKLDGDNIKFKLTPCSPRLKSK